MLTEALLHFQVSNIERNKFSYGNCRANEHIASTSCETSKGSENSNIDSECKYRNHDEGPSKHFIHHISIILGTCKAVQYSPI